MEEHKLTVNFNNLRRQAVFSVDSLVKSLNKAILKGENHWGKPNDLQHNQEIELDGYVLISAEDIEDDLNNLVNIVQTIAIVFEDGNENFKDLTSEIPKPVWFNPEEE